MTQPPPHDPAPGEQPWQGPGGQQPPPYRGSYGGQPSYGEQPSYGGQPYAGAPGYAGPAGEHPGPAAVLASRWARLGAIIIDAILMGLVVGLATLPFADWGRLVEDPTGDLDYRPTGQLAASFVGILLAFLYFWLMTANRGQTLGKIALGIRVVRAEDGGAISNGQAAGRAAFYNVLGGICGCVAFIDVLWILWDDRKQCLHDKVAKTVVVKVDKSQPDPYRRA